MPASSLTASARVLFAALIGILFLSSALAADQSLNALRQNLSIIADKDKVSISGISSGGWMAVQYHIAHSSEIMGAGVIAAGPYHCAGGGAFFACGWSWTRADHDICRALTVCAGPFAGTSEQLSFQQSFDDTEQEASRGGVDPLWGLKGDRVWLFSGTKDDIEPQRVVQSLNDYYAALFDLPAAKTPSSHLQFVDDKPAGHGVPIGGPADAQSCASSEPPYIIKCGYPAAEKMMAFFYPQAAARATHGVPPGVESFDQGALFSTNDPSLSMSMRGHIYVPRQCRGGAACPLHIALHGCQQSEDRGRMPAASPAGTAYFFDSAGYNAWAESHGVIVLYPQAKPWGLGTDQNPMGCWDWWGYSGADYFRKTAPQMRTIRAMVQCLTGEAACP